MLILDKLFSKFSSKSKEPKVEYEIIINHENNSTYIVGQNKGHKRTPAMDQSTLQQIKSTLEAKDQKDMKKGTNKNKESNQFEDAPIPKKLSTLSENKMAMKYTQKANRLFEHKKADIPIFTPQTMSK